MTDDLLSLENTKTEATEYAPSSIIKTGIRRSMIMEKEVKHYFTPITGLSKGLPAKEHNFTSQGTQLCRKSIFLQEKECKWCKELDRFDPDKKKLNKAKDVFLLPIYMFNSVGKDIEYDINKGTKEEKHISFPDNPIQFLSVTRGPEDANLQELKSYDDDGELTTTLFEIQRYPKALKKAPEPKFTDRKKAEKLFQHIGGCVVPQEILEDWDEMSKEQVRGLAGNTYGVFNDSAPKIMFEFLEKPEPLPDEEETGEVDASKEMDG